MELNEPLSIRQLEVFVALVEHKSFTKAAQAVGLSQSTVSGHVADLERRLGATLVQRERSGVKLTASGQALLPPAREVLRAERAARQAVQDLTGLSGGQLIVGGSTIPATHLLPGLFSRFHESYPAVSLRLVAGDSSAIVESVLSSELEVGIVGSDPDDANIESSVIGQDRLLLVAKAGHPLASSGRIKLTDLREYGLVRREPGSGTRAESERLLGGEPVPTVCEMGSTESVVAAVRAGIAPAFLSELAVAADLASGALVELSLPTDGSKRQFHLVTRAGAVLSPAARAFVSLARDS